MPKASGKLTRMVRAWTALASPRRGFTIFASAAQALPPGFWGVVPQSNLSAEQYPASRATVAPKASASRSAGLGADGQGRRLRLEKLRQPGGRGRESGHQSASLPLRRPEWAVPTKKVPGAGGLLTPAYLPVSGAARTGWAAFMTAAVARYGPSGSFWSEHPGIPQRPIRSWQIWNEPNFKYFIARPNPAEYGKLVKISYTALKAADPGAQVVLAGLFARPERRPQRRRQTQKPQLVRERLPRADVQDDSGAEDQVQRRRSAPVHDQRPGTAGSHRRIPQRPGREQRRRQAALDHRARLERGPKSSGTSSPRARPARRAN